MVSIFRILYLRHKLIPVASIDEAQAIFQAVSMDIVLR